jgi:hypothetical protein
MSLDTSSGSGTSLQKTCPYCHELIHHLAIRCKHCHADLTGTVPSASSAPSREVRPQDDAPKLQCPSCKGYDVKKKSLVHRMGTTHTTGVGVGVGVGRGGLGLGAGVSGSKSQSQLAREAAPPPPGVPTVATAAIVTAIIILPLVGIWTLVIGKSMDFFVGMSLGFGLPLFLIVVLVIALLPKSSLQKHLEEQDSTRRIRYERSYVCMICGAEFEPKRG